MRKLLTISIAAYNVEKYIEQTLNSLIIPEILDELEVFIIDDGGNDNTASIARKYETEYPETFHVINKENGGYGTTVNWSVENATGKYIKLLDGDDWVDSHGLKILIERLRKSEADVIVSNAILSEEGKANKEMYPHCRVYDNKIMSLDEASKFPVVAMWGYTFKLDVVRKNYKSLPKKTLYTDQIFVMRALENSKTIEFIGHPVYHWRIGRNEQSNNINSIRKHYNEIIKVANIIMEEYNYMEKNNPNKSFPYQLKRAAAYYSTSIDMLRKLERNKKNFKLIKEWDKQVLNEMPKIYKCTNKVKKLFLLRITGYLSYWII